MEKKMRNSEILKRQEELLKKIDRLCFEKKTKINKFKIGKNKK